MKRLLVILVAALFFTVGADGHAQPHRPFAAAKKMKKKHRGRAPARLRSSSPFAAAQDEIVLSTPLMKQLQRNLVDGGYLRSRADGRLGARTRRALADFQREYHMVGTGALDRRTAEALLGRDTVGAYRLASVARAAR